MPPATAPTPSTSSDTPAGNAQRPAAAARGARAIAALAAALALAAPSALHATTPLADQPVFSNITVPGNLVLALSVEYPTANSVAHPNSTYDPATSYLGYFDPRKCYVYVTGSTDAPSEHFAPSGSTVGATATAPGTCTGAQDSKWSGNFLNWATMQTIDPFRWALTGGYRSLDTPTATLLEKANASGQGGAGNFPDRTLGSSTLVAGATPFNWSQLKMRVQGLGNQLYFTASADVNSSTPQSYAGATSLDGSKLWKLNVRVRVCVSDVSTGPMESNCTAYPAGNYKPTGLIQQYAERMTFSAFGYLNDSNLLRDGGVLRARQKFVAPQYQLPTMPVTTNPLREWDPNDGTFVRNPDAADAAATTTASGVTVADSGVINYLNKFGKLTPGAVYKTHDNISELYYAALRYLKNQGNVPEWTSMAGASAATRQTWIDGFPVIENWGDPIRYACQRNFILGIGDVNTHADRNLPGTTTTAKEPAKPSAVAGDTSVNAVTATNKIGELHGLGASLGTVYPYNGCCNDNSTLLAGLAYDANTRDIRPDLPNTGNLKQTVQTYWLDVLEYGAYKANNQFYLAAKYGGFKVPDGFDPYARTTDIDLDWWYTTTDLTPGGQKRPDNYFTAARASEMVSGLERAFASIGSNLKPFTTSFATSLPQVSTTGTASYSARYDASNWTGDLTAATNTFSVAGAPESTQVWSFAAKLAAQAAGTGWDTKRRIVTWKPDAADNGSGPGTSSGAGVPLRVANLTTAQKTALDTAYRSNDDSTAYLSYLRGDRSNEEGAATVSPDGAYRRRDSLLGDIVNAKPRVVGAPVMPYSDATNPGYAAFRSARAARPTMVYVGSNDGMLHAIHGGVRTPAGAVDPAGGTEVFAYVPSALFKGPAGTPSTHGLAARGDPDFTHRYYVDASPVTHDIDFARTAGAAAGASADWRTVLVGGLGKGGRSYYALDVTDPGSIDTAGAASAAEPTVAARVLWEFTDPDLGYTYGQPLAVKTRKHGWVLLFGSGYNNSSGRGYLFIVHPRTGRLLEKVEARSSSGGPVGSSSSQAGLAHVQAFVLDRTDGLVDAAYAGDLLGNVWRFDLTAATGSYPRPTLLAQLRDASGQPQPVTSRPLVVVQPVTNTRWITVGTGRLLDTGDITSVAPQTMYAIKDGSGVAFAGTAPTGFSYPIQRSQLKGLTDLTAKVTLNPATENGWYVDLGLGSTGLGWRVINDPSSFYGIVEFSAILPSGDVCTPSGTSRIYAIELGTGQSNLVQADGVTPLAYSDALRDLVTDLGSKSVGGERRLIGCGNSGGCTNIQVKRPDALTLRRLNWRELPLAN